MKTKLNALAEKRKRKNLSERQLAEKAGLKIAVVQAAEAGEDVDPIEALRLADALGYDLATVEGTMVPLGLDGFLGVEQMTQQELADSIGVSLRTINGAVAGEPVSVPLAKKIAAELCITLDELAKGKRGRGRPRYRGPARSIATLIDRGGWSVVAAEVQKQKAKD